MSEEENKMKSQLEEGQLVLCNVEKISGTSVFVKIEDYNLQGTITFPEISPGRIRNIRDFVFPGKKIVCKVLRLKPGMMELSLRRVKVNERNEFNERYKREKSYTAMLKTMLKEKAESMITKIKEDEASLFDFFEKVKENSKLLEKYLSQENSEKINKILSEKKVKEKIISKKFSLFSKDSSGINIIKTIMKESSKGTDCEFSYISAGKYIIKIKTKNPKQGEAEMNKVIDNIETLSKRKYCSNCTFNVQK